MKMCGSDSANLGCFEATQIWCFPLEAEGHACCLVRQGRQGFDRLNDRFGIVGEAARALRFLGRPMATVP